jgi:hypothetical protein
VNEGDFVSRFFMQEIEMGNGDMCIIWNRLLGVLYLHLANALRGVREGIYAHQQQW